MNEDSLPLGPRGHPVGDLNTSGPGPRHMKCGPPRRGNARSRKREAEG